MQLCLMFCRDQESKLLTSFPIRKQVPLRLCKLYARHLKTPELAARPWQHQSSTTGACNIYCRYGLALGVRRLVRQTKRSIQGPGPDIKRVLGQRIPKQTPKQCLTTTACSEGPFNSRRPSIRYLPLSNNPLLPNPVNSRQRHQRHGPQRPPTRIPLSRWPLRPPLVHLPPALRNRSRHQI